MANIIINMSRLVDYIQNPAIVFAQKNVDRIVQRLSNSELKPLILDNKTVIAHSESPRYSDGNIIPDYIQVNSADLKDSDKDLLQLHNELVNIKKESRLVLNYLKLTVHNAVILANDANDFNPTEEIYYLVRSNVPEHLLQDTALLEFCFNTKIESDLFLNATKGRLTEEHIKEFKDKTTFPNATALIDKYYTLLLLTQV